MYNAHPLPVPVPPMLEAAIGYAGQSRFIAFYWTPSGDEVILADGQTSFDANWQAYLAYVMHARVSPGLAPYNFGSSESPATHWLVLDRTQRQVYALPAADARQLLRDQYPPQGEPVQLTHEQWEALTNELHQRMQELRNDPNHHRLVLEHMAQQDQLTRDLQHWLNAPN